MKEREERKEKRKHPSKAKAPRARRRLHLDTDSESDEPEAEHVDPDSEPEPEPEPSPQPGPSTDGSSESAHPRHRGVLPARFRDDISDNNGVLCELCQLNESLGMAGDTVFWVDCDSCGAWVGKLCHCICI